MKFSSFSTIFTLLVLFTCYDEIHSLDSPCGTWASFKDEKCFGILDDTVRTFADAESACAKLGNSPTLPLIHSAEEQEFLSNFLFKTSKKVANFWLGAKVVNSKVAWIDNSELGYTNWDSKGPRNKTNYCVQMEYDESVVGKWIDEPCETKNLVVCQRMQTWSMVRLQKTLLDTRKESRDALDEANKQINNLKQMLGTEKSLSSKSIADLKNALEVEKNSNLKNITDLKQNLIPIGFIYPQLPNEKSPAEIWPSMTWTDVSATYAGVFFRVNGGGSESFGQTQAENSQKLVFVENSKDIPNAYSKLTLDNGSSNIKSTDWIWTGSYAKQESTFSKMFLRFTVTTGENRPRNMAIRIWKRTN